MRVLLDESVPIGLAPELTGHEVESVSGRGWAGITNSELLRRASGEFDVLVTTDQNLPFQQTLRVATLGMILVRAHSNRLVDVRPFTPNILAVLAEIQPGELSRVGT